MGILTKNKKNSSPLKAGFWYTVSNFIVKGIVFITMPIFTRVMNSNDIGLFSNISSWFSIFAIIATFQLYSSVNIAKFEYPEELDSYISSNLFLGSIITTIWYILILIFKDFFVELFNIDIVSLNIIFIYLLFYPAIEMYQAKNRIDFNYKSSVFLSILSCVVSTTFALLLVLISKNKFIGRVFGYYLPLIVISIIVYLCLMLRGKSISRKYWRFALSVSFPLIWHLLAGTLLNSCDKIMITKIIGSTANAKYSVAYTCSMVVSLLWTSMNSAWSPWAFDMMKANDANSLKKNVRPYLLFFCGVALMFMLFAPELLYVMGGINYIDAINVLPPVMLGYVFQFVYSLYINIEYFNRKQQYIAIGTVFAALVNIILNMIFIPIFGYIAAAYTTLIGYITLFVIHYLIVKHMKLSYLYDIKFFTKVLLLMSISAVIINFLYDYILIRYFLIITIGVTFVYILIKNKNQLSKFMKKKTKSDL